MCGFGCRGPSASTATARARGSTPGTAGTGSTAAASTQAAPFATLCVIRTSVTSELNTFELICVCASVIAKRRSACTSMLACMPRTLALVVSDGCHYYACAMLASVVV